MMYNIRTNTKMGFMLNAYYINCMRHNMLQFSKYFVIAIEIYSTWGNNFSAETGERVGKQ